MTDINPFRSSDSQADSMQPDSAIDYSSDQNKNSSSTPSSSDSVKRLVNDILSSENVTVVPAVSRQGIAPTAQRVKAERAHLDAARHFISEVVDQIRNACGGEIAHDQLAALTNLTVSATQAAQETTNALSEETIARLLKGYAIDGKAIDSTLITQFHVAYVLSALLSIEQEPVVFEAIEGLIRLDEGNPKEKSEEIESSLSRAIGSLTATIVDSTLVDSAEDAQ
jgi:hypothetical protein